MKLLQTKRRSILNPVSGSNLFTFLYSPLPVVLVHACHHAEDQRDELGLGERARDVDRLPGEREVAAEAHLVQHRMDVRTLFVQS